MGRKRVKLAFIENLSAWIASMRKRRRNLIKKAQELSILYGVQVLCIVYSLDEPGSGLQTAQKLNRSAKASGRFGRQSYRRWRWLTWRQWGKGGGRTLLFVGDTGSEWRLGRRRGVSAATLAVVVTSPEWGLGG
ncbi:hypothetical protein LINPERPRIM_LOCUS7904 [Linum perenne]